VVGLGGLTGVGAAMLETFMDVILGVSASDRDRAMTKTL
jgi:hypothetical protein